MTKRRNKKTTVAKRFGAVLLAVLMLVAAVPNTTTVYAATNVVVARNNEEPKTLGNITIQVSNAAVNEKVGNEDIPINGMNVATAAAVDEMVRRMYSGLVAPYICIRTSIREKMAIAYQLHMESTK